MVKVDFGCGNSKKEGFIGVDSIPLSGVDIIHDLNKFPYPFENDTIDEIWMDNVLEHLDKPLSVMEELYRISKNNAVVNIAVPYFRSLYSVIDPTHKNFFSVYWFYYFDPNHVFYSKYNYTKSKFIIEKFEFDREWDGQKKNIIHKVVLWLANKKPESYEHRISHLYPLNSLTYKLRVIK